MAITGWVSKFDYDFLMDMRLCDLDVEMNRGKFSLFFEKLYSELSQKGISFRPHYWISDEWFVPDGVSGIAIPFYLIHKHLVRLERMEMGFVEGANSVNFLKLLRHETGHALENAFGLRMYSERKFWFGDSSKVRYPQSYEPQAPYTQDFVDYLGEAYGQSHPDEDFAETFAVWLDPNFGWKKKYKGLALSKLKAMDRLINSLKGVKPRLNERNVDPIHRDTRTIRQFYIEKTRHFKVGKYASMDGSLSELFSPADNCEKLGSIGSCLPYSYDWNKLPGFGGAENNSHYINDKRMPRGLSGGLKRISSKQTLNNVRPEKVNSGRKATAKSFIQSIRTECKGEVARALGIHSYKVDRIIQKMLHRCEQLNLRLDQSIAQTKAEFLDVLTDQTLEEIRRGRDKIIL